MTSLHFLRPGWFLALLPLAILGWFWLRRKTQVDDFLNRVCDPHLLEALCDEPKSSRRSLPYALLIVSMSLTIIALAGPTWSRLSVPHYQTVAPKIVLLDLSDAMLKTDRQPDRITRARFKIRDILHQGQPGPYGLIAFTSAAFLVSPLTDDPDTIDVLLDQLTPDIVPVGGHDMVPALQQAAALISDAGFSDANIVIFTAHPPSEATNTLAKTLAEKGIHVSILPLPADDANASRYEAFAQIGQGVYLPFTEDNQDILRWLDKKSWLPQYQQTQHASIAFKDEGRLFLIPALLLLLPIFRRGWFSRVSP